MNKHKLAAWGIAVAMPLLMGAAGGCQPQDKTGGNGKPFTWEVYSYDAQSCNCKPDKINLNDPKFHKAETLVLVKWGFTLTDGTVRTKSSTGDSTPWHHTEFGPKNPLAMELYAQAADATSALVCVLYEGELNLGVFVGDGRGQCSASSDVD